MRERNPILNTVRRTLAIALVGVVATLAGLAPGHAQMASGLALAPGDPAPKLIGWGMDQQIKSFSYEGRLTLVNFWATWCGPCREEMPRLEAMQERFADQGFQVVGFNQEPEATLELVTEHLESLGVTYPNLKPDRRWNWGGVSTVPTSYLVGPDGRILRKYIGAQPEQIAGLERDVEDAINGRQLKSMVMPKPPKPDED